MKFRLLQFPQMSVGYVRFEAREFQVWSPNSMQIPAYTGRRREDARPSTMPVRPNRRYDGHAGKHDCLYVPQYCSPANMHWPFMRRISAVQPDDPYLRAFLPFADQWEDIPSGGQLKPAFVDQLSVISRDLESRMQAVRPTLSQNSRTWDTRPMYPSTAQVEALRELRMWDAAVDQTTAMQRGLREKEAWLEFLRVRMEQNEQGLTLPLLRRLRMPPAREEFIGLWVNGCDENLVLRYMAAGVPCFVIHELKTMSSLVPSSISFRPSFIHGTEVAVLLSEAANPYHAIARRQGLLHSMVSRADGRGIAVEGTYEERLLSSLEYLKCLVPPRLSSLAQLQEEARSSKAQPSAAVVPAPLSSAMPPSSPAVPPILGPLPAPARTDPYAAPGLTKRVIEKRRVQWIVPPKIAAGGV
ncbi:hypothetical protein DFH06DRAFT_1348670 [Mycena polygramma]|nr:hypothetical protein DFH06DRAFT_1348670 [Mycena polygramma]